MKKTVQLLKIIGKEDYLGHKNIFNIIMFIICFALSTGNLQFKIMGYIWIVLWLACSTFMVFTFFRRSNSDYLLLESPKTEKSKFFMLLQGCLYDNIYNFIVLLLVLNFSFHTSFINSLIIAFVHFLYALSIGIICGNLFNYKLGAIVLIGYFVLTFYFSASWAMDEPWRHFSMTLQLYNTSIINFTNLLPISFLGCFFIINSYFLYQKFIKYKMLKTGLISALYLILLSIIIIQELNYNRQYWQKEYEVIKKEENTIFYQKVNSKDVEFFMNIVSKEILNYNNLGVSSMELDQFYFNRYYVSSLPYYNTRPIPISLDGEKVTINIFSNAQINTKEPELIRDFMNRLYDQLIINNEHSKNKYIYQLLEGCREYIFIDTIKNVDNDTLKNIQITSKELIDKRVNASVTESNFLKKAAGIMYETYPQELKKLHNIIMKRNPQTDQEMITCFKSNFPDIYSDREINNIFTAIIEEGSNGR